MSNNEWAITLLTTAQGKAIGKDSIGSLIKKIKSTQTIQCASNLIYQYQSFHTKTQVPLWSVDDIFFFLVKPSLAEFWHNPPRQRPIATDSGDSIFTRYDIPMHNTLLHTSIGNEGFSWKMRIAQDVKTCSRSCAEAYSTLGFTMPSLTKLLLRTIDNGMLPPLFSSMTTDKESLFTCKMIHLQASW